MGPRFCKRGNVFGVAGRVAGDEASMGPRFCKCGNAGAPVVDYLASQLQWGHAFVSVETRRVLHAVRGHYRLQWGHAFVSVETVSRTVGQVYHLSSPLRPEVVRQAHILAG